MISSENCIVITTTLNNKISKLRKKNLISNFNKYNIPIHFIRGIQYDQWEMYESFESLLNMITCFKNMPEQYNYAIICQDDFYPIDNFLDELNNTTNLLPNDWECLHLCPGFLWGRGLIKQKIGILNPTTNISMLDYDKSGRFFTNCNPYIYYNNSLWLGGPIAFVIKKNIIDKFIYNYNNNYDADDRTLVKILNNKTFICRNPLLGIEEECGGTSSIKMKNNLIIGCYNYSDLKLITNKGGIEPFIKSLRKHNKTCTVVVLMDTCTDVIKSFFDTYNIKYFTGFKGNLMYARFIVYYQYLSQDINYDKILLTDMNDVIFQNDPFSISITNNNIYYAQEIHCYDNINNPGIQMNLEWILDAHNKNSNLKPFNINNYIGKNVVCAGTILGYTTDILEYLKWYGLNQDKNISINDQGLLNIYLYEIMKTDVVNLNESSILTMNNLDLKNILRNDDGYFINQNRKLYTILHQACIYDDNLKYITETVLNNDIFF